MKNVFSKNKKYVAEYRRWFDKLPKKQKALMKQLGLDKPHIDDYTTRQKFAISDIQIADEAYTPVSYTHLSLAERKLHRHA